MTPKELCDLAAKINAAVPGLVPSMKDDNWQLVVYIEVETKSHHDQARDWDTDYHDWVVLRLPDAAAMMLGRVDAWCRWAALNDHGGKAYTTIVQCGCELDAYVQSTLPGAKA